MKKDWIKLNNEYDKIILDILDKKDIVLNIDKIKKIQKKLFDLETKILDKKFKK